MLNESIYLHYLSALLEADKNTCKSIVAKLIDEEVPLKEIYVNLLQRSMYRIGQLWEANKCSIASEHIATKITEEVLSFTINGIKKKAQNGKLIILACVDKEFHEIGPRIISDYFEIHGWDSIFLGSNTPHFEILKMVEIKQPELVGLSNNFYINIFRLIRIVEEILERFPDQKIIIGGQALENGIPDKLNSNKNVKYIPNLETLDRYFL